MILGHSHVRNLNDVIRTNFRIDSQEADIRLFGRGGMKILDLLSDDIIGTVQSFQPETLILMIGDNDVKPSPWTGNVRAAHKIVDKLFEAILTIHATVSSIRQVFLCQLLPRHPGRYYRSGYNNIALMVNQLLLQSAVAAQQEYLRLFRFRDFCFPQERPERYSRNQKLFRRDGTHLTPRGYRRLERAVRAVVVSSIRS